MNHKKFRLNSENEKAFRVRTEKTIWKARGSDAPMMIPFNIPAMRPDGTVAVSSLPGNSIVLRYLNSHQKNGIMISPAIPREPKN